MRAPFLLVPLFGLLLAGCDRGADAPGQGNGTAARMPTAPASDEVASDGAPVAAPKVAIDRSHKGEPAPTFAFTGAGGKVSVAGFRGKPVLVNLWATWCAPCVKELPTLDALAAKRTVEVAALSQDVNAAKARGFLVAKGFKSLRGYTDPDMQWLGPVTTNLPTTILYDAQGKEVWRVLGDLDWTGAMATEALAEVG